MTRSSLLCGVLGLVGVGLIATTPLACSSGGVGDPCTPEDEYDTQFPGFQRTLENIESRSFQCQTRICLVNHFQGRVSCPLGQPPMDGTDTLYPQNRLCNALDASGQFLQGPDKTVCDNLHDGSSCTITVPIATDCDPTDKNSCGTGGQCDAQGKFCHCDAGGQKAPPGYACNKQSHQFEAYVCHKTGNCQTADGSTDDNCDNGHPKDCCVPGTDKPVVSTVCSQCDSSSNRDAAQAVYCSCRCDVDPADTRDPNFNYCDCPTGYECSLIRPDIGLGDVQITGQYCIKSNTAYVTPDPGCSVPGYFDSTGMACPSSNQVTTGACNGGGS